MRKLAAGEPVRATIYDVAAHAGVSSSTVSRVLAGRDLVAAPTRDKVLRAAGELGYRTNAVARSLARQDSDTVAILLPDLTNPFFPSLVSELQAEAQRRGHVVILGSSGEDVEVERRYLDTMLSKQVRYVFAVGLRLRRQEVEAYTAAGLIFVALDRALAGSDGYLVQSDNRHGARIATAHLIGLGHRQIAHIAGPADVAVARARRRGFHDAMAAAGLPVDERLVVESPFSEVGGAAAFQRLHQRWGEFTAVFAANDLIAIGALFDAHQRGLNAPDDFSLVGFDDVSLTRYTSPQLTTVRQDVVAMARAGVELVFPAQASKRRRRTVTLPVTLVVRGSTGPPASGRVTRK